MSDLNRFDRRSLAAQGLRPRMTSNAKIESNVTQLGRQGGNRLELVPEQESQD